MTDSSQDRFSFACSCGKVTGHVTTTMSRNAIRCYCHSCRQYGDWCRAQQQQPNPPKEPDDTDDGGIDILQICKKDLCIDAGCEEHIQLAKLNSKTLTYRFYSACCMTPLCNTSPSVGFLGFVVENFKNKNGDHFKPYHLLYTEDAPGPIHESRKDDPPASYLKFFYVLLAFLPWRRSADVLPFDMEPKIVTSEEDKGTAT